MGTYKEGFDEHIEKNLEDDVHHHGLARDTNNPKAIKPALDILEECFGLAKPDFLDEYVRQLVEDVEKDNEK